MRCLSEYLMCENLVFANMVCENLMFVALGLGDLL